MYFVFQNLNTILNETHLRDAESQISSRMIQSQHQKSITGKKSATQETPQDENMNKGCIVYIQKASCFPLQLGNVCQKADEKMSRLLDQIANLCEKDERCWDHTSEWNGAPGFDTVHVGGRSDCG